MRCADSGGVARRRPQGASRHAVCARSAGMTLHLAQDSCARKVWVLENASRDDPVPVPSCYLACMLARMLQCDDRFTMLKRVLRDVRSDGRVAVCMLCMYNEEAGLLLEAQHAGPRSLQYCRPSFMYGERQQCVGGIDLCHATHRSCSLCLHV